MMHVAKANDYRERASVAARACGLRAVGLVQLVSRSISRMQDDDMDRAQRLIARSTLAATVVHELERADTKSAVRKCLGRAAKHLEDALEDFKAFDDELAGDPIELSSVFNGAQQAIEQARQVAQS